jgi:hypothetical protein
MVLFEIAFPAAPGRQMAWQLTLRNSKIVYVFPSRRLYPPDPLEEASLEIKSYFCAFR